MIHYIVAGDSSSSGFFPASTAVAAIQIIGALRDAAVLGVH
jgi:hypothetical protein